MKTTSLKSIARHMAAVTAGTVTKTNVIGMRKAINDMERGGWPSDMIDAQFELEEAIAQRRPVVAGELHESGLKVLRNPRYAKRWTQEQRDIIEAATAFRLVRFDRLGDRGRYSVPVFRVVSPHGWFTFRNIPWQTAYYGGLDDGPRVVPERG
jgi:hypothetical protein